MKLLCWELFGCSEADVLGNSVTLTEDSTTLSMVNHSQDQAMQGSLGCCSLDWLKQLQQSSCPLVRLLILGLLVLPLYNALLIVVGWRLNCSASSSAERLVLDIRVAKAVKRRAPSPPSAPKPPPRIRRRRPPTIPAPSRKLRSPELLSSRGNPFELSEDQADQYRNLRNNLQLVLEGLQKPQPPAKPLTPPEPIFVPPAEEEPLSVPELLTPPESPRMEPQKPRSKFHVFKRLWLRWRSRRSRKKPTTPEASTTSSNCSSTGSSCFYVY
ncbi:uncharacterized protein LOC108099073 [Drosophila ficusphila]|uniref:uncharacterized protein LOC108099073 n=1 Tax=Drosophila ficusphila TaxID=30025 RepID=UPI0007E78697|nr:uncharacterized protein LOC108099073 [Drosophila ficusphila]